MSGYKDRCRACGKELKYNIIEDTYEFCDCAEQFPNILGNHLTMATDQVSISDSFESDIQAVITKYCGQGMTVGTAIGALQNRLFNLNLNVHMPSILDILKRHLK